MKAGKGSDTSKVSEDSAYQGNTGKGAALNTTKSSEDSLAELRLESGASQQPQPVPEERGLQASDFTSKSGAAQRLLCILSNFLAIKRSCGL